MKTDTDKPMSLLNLISAHLNTLGCDIKQIRVDREPAFNSHVISVLADVKGNDYMVSHHLDIESMTVSNVLGTAEGIANSIARHLREVRNEFLEWEVIGTIKA